MELDLESTEGDLHDCKQMLYMPEHHYTVKMQSCHTPDASSDKTFSIFSKQCSYRSMQRLSDPMDNKILDTGP